MGSFLLSAIPGGSALATSLAGLLTYDSNEIHTFPHFHAVVIVKFSPLTAAGTVPDFHRIPLTNISRLRPNVFLVKILIAWQGLYFTPTL